MCGVSTSASAPACPWETSTRSGTRPRWVWGLLSPTLYPPKPALCRGVTPTRAPQGVQWVKLSPEEIPGRIQAITGKRGRPRNAEKAKPKEPPATKRGRGRPPKVRMVDLLSKTDARLLKKLEAQGAPFPALVGETLTARPWWDPGTWFMFTLLLCPLPEVLSEEDKLKMSKIKKKMRRKVRAWGSGDAQVWVGGVPWCRGSLSRACPPLRPRTSRSRRPKPPGPRRPRRNRR